MIGIYGGTFDPIHHGHLRTALEVREAVGLTELRFVPCRHPPHRGVPSASPEQRLELLRAALAGGEAGFSIDDRELHRPGPSYMIETLQSIRREIGSRPLCLIIGWDAFCGLHRWHRWQELFTQAHVLVMQRPGGAALPDVLRSVLAAREHSDPARLRRLPAGLILEVAVTQLDISASRLRALAAQGRSLRYLTPDPVWKLIGELGLYRTGEALVTTRQSASDKERQIVDQAGPTEAGREQ